MASSVSDNLARVRVFNAWVAAGIFRRASILRQYKTSYLGRVLKAQVYYLGAKYAELSECYTREYIEKELRKDNEFYNALQLELDSRVEETKEK